MQNDWCLLQFYDMVCCALFQGFVNDEKNMFLNPPWSESAHKTTSLLGNHE